MEPAIARRALRCAVMKLPVFAYRDVGYESREFLFTPAQVSAPS
jgi:hypothetical protein